MERYNIKIVEKKWQEIWAKKKVDSVSLDKNKKTTEEKSAYL